MGWMNEREIVRELKEGGHPKPWSQGPIFQQTYFCNVHRENDKVTKYIRSRYSGEVRNPMFEVNIGFARWINLPSALAYLPFMDGPWHDDAARKWMENELLKLQRQGVTVFGSAYIVSTNGRQLPKATYICEYLLPALYEAVGPGGRLNPYPQHPTLAQRFTGLRSVYGLGSFMAGQLLADFKNTIGHPLYLASDKSDWSCPGPGSLRGLGWIFNGTQNPIKTPAYYEAIALVRKVLYGDLGCEIQVDNQDLQNCLCEFDKYMRIDSGVGRSKRKYPGAA